MLAELPPDPLLEASGKNAGPSAADRAPALVSDAPRQPWGFRSEEALASLRAAEARLPADVQAYLRRHREEVDDVLDPSAYATAVLFVPAAANRARPADAVVRFIRPGTITPGMEAALGQPAVVAKPKRVLVASEDLLRPTEVVNLVRERLPFRFTFATHQQPWQHHAVRPAANAADRAGGDRQAAPPVGSPAARQQPHPGMGGHARPAS